MHSWRAMALSLVAMRFAALADGSYLDLATGCRAIVRIAASSPNDRAAHAAAGATPRPDSAQRVSLDFGPVGRDCWFEAWAPEGSSGHVGKARRPLVDGLLNRLEEVCPIGAFVCNVPATPESVWTASWLDLARALRQRGWVPVTAAVLEHHARDGAGEALAWAERLADARLAVAHAVTTSTGLARQRLAGLLMALGAHGINAVVFNVRTARVAGAPPDALAEDELPDAAHDHDRAARFLVHDGDAARAGERERGHAAGILLSASRLSASGRPGAGNVLIRKRAGEFLRRGRGRESLQLWAELATRCVRSGRHQEGQRAWREAWRHAERLGDVGEVLEAAPRLAAAWILDLSPVRAEALLRSAMAAVGIAGRPVPGLRALLAESLWWQGRWRESLEAAGEEPGRAAAVRASAHLALGDPGRALQDAIAAAAALEPGGPASEALVAWSARLQVDVALGDTPHADLCAERLASLSGLDDDGAMARDLVVAETFVARRRSIPPDVRRRLKICARGRGPRLARARARLALCLDAGDATRITVESEVRRVALATNARALLPDDRAFPWPWPNCSSAPRSPMLHDIVEILQACQRDADPNTALQGLCGLVAERTNAIGVVVLLSTGTSMLPVGRVGRPPSGDVAARSASLGAPVGPEAALDGLEAAWPIQHGDEPAGVLACRWAGASRPSADALALAQAAATAMAPLVSLSRHARAAMGTSAESSELIGSSPAMGVVRAAIERAGPSPFPVLIEGESGAGKELVARAIHGRSTRRSRRFAALNCAALADDLIEAELFGHARGAFTGAIAERPGLFEEADGGTLFLDEVGELSPRAQAKLLRAIQEGEIRRVGETKARRVDVRIVAATNRSLEAEAAAGRFRTDLRFRLDVIRINVPPLRGRPEDVAELARHFWRQAAARVGSRAVLGREAVAALARHPWPGNVRELQNVLAALAVSAPKRGVLGAGALPALAGHEAADALTLGEARRRFDATFVRGALARAGGCRTRAAIDLGLTRQGLAKLMERLGIVAEDEALRT